MATAAVEIPSHNRVEPGSNQLKLASYPTEVAPVSQSIEPNKVATEWAEKFNKTLSGNYDGIKDLFLSGSCWRDQLGLSWNYHTFNGPEKMISFLKEAPKGSRVKSIAIDSSTSKRQPIVAPVDYNGKVNGVASFLIVDTDVGRGRGLVRLLQDAQDGGKWKAFTLLTAMHELKGHEETTFGNRPNGVDHGGQPGRKNWKERRTAQENFEGDLEPTVLIIGRLSIITVLIVTDMYFQGLAKVG